MKNRKRMIALFILITLMVAAFTADIWMTASPSTIDSSQRLLPPTLKHWFGTDHFGRDIFSLTIIASRVSLVVGVLVAVLSTIFGSVLGLIAGYYQRLDTIIMRVIDGMLAFPSLLLALALVAAIGGSVFNIIIALTFSFSASMTRVVRSAVLQIKSVQYIEAAKTSGVQDVIILMKYIYINILSTVIVQGTFVFAKAILAEAALSFLGVGVEPSTPTWGNMLQESQLYITISPWMSIFPGIAIMITVLSLNILGDDLRNSFDPHNRTRAKSKFSINNYRELFKKKVPSNDSYS